MGDWRVDSSSSESSISYGQSLLSKAKKKRKKREKKAKIAKYTALGLGIGDMILAKKANKQIEYLNEQEAFDLNQRKSDWGDKVGFEQLYDTIYQAGYNPNEEESYRNYFYDKAAEDYNSANVDKEIHPNKDTWVDVKMGNYIKDWKGNLKDWKPWLRATEAEFETPVKEYYKQQIRNVLRPGNTSTVRKVLMKFGLWEDEEIKLTFENGKYAGALRNTKSVDEAYNLAMKNTTSRLETLRGDGPTDTQYEDLPTLMKFFTLSKKVDASLQQQVADAFIVDKSGMLFGQTLKLNPENLPAKVSPQSALGQQMLRMQAIMGTAPTDDSQERGNIIHDTFYKYATRAAPGDEGYDPDKPGLGWTEDRWKQWFNNERRGEENFQNLLYHRLAGPDSAKDIRDHFATEFGGQWETSGSSALFMMVWARRAQNLWDIEKRTMGIKLTEGANPADWGNYIERAFRETLQNDLVLREDGRLEIVESNSPAVLLEDSIGPKPFKEEGEETETIVTEGTPGGAPETETPVSRITDDMSEDLKKSIIAVEQFSITTEDDIELQGPAAVIYNQLDEGEDLKEVRKRIRELTQFFPEEKENMNSVLLDFQDKLIDELTSSEVTTTPMSLEEEIQGTLTAEQIGEKLAKKGRASATAGFGTAWNARKDYERRQRLEWRLTGERSVGDYQFARDLKNAGLSENASSKDIRAYLYGEEEDTLVAAE